MYDRHFWNTKLGQAAFASILAMSAMVALNSQFQATHLQVGPGSLAAIAVPGAAVELA